jgi:hypothetical protein
MVSPILYFQPGFLIVSDLTWSTIELEGLPENWSQEVGIYPFIFGLSGMDCRMGE